MPEVLKTYFVEGDLGDCLAALPAIRQLGGGALVLGPCNPHRCRAPMTRARFDFIAPLLRVQPYLASVDYSEAGPNGADVDFSRFRELPTWAGENLAHWHARYAGLPQVDVSPWLHVVPSHESEGKAVFSRSPRYHNPRFPWVAMIDRYPDHLFIGNHDEVVGLQAQTQRRVNHRPVRDMLEMAQIIAGSVLFVGNQSCPCWVAMGLGHPLVQETCARHPNSRIERDNAKFVEGV